MNRATMTPDEQDQQRRLTMTDWNELRDRVHALAVEKGWHETERSDDELAVLVVTEIAEAVEAYRERGFEAWTEGDGKPCGFASEIADAVIRMLDWAGLRGIGVELAPDQDGEHDYPEDDVPAEISWNRLAESIEDTMRAEQDMAIMSLVFVAEDARFDLVAEIERKHEFNKTRPHRHGGKRA